MYTMYVVVENPAIGFLSWSSLDLHATEQTSVPVSLTFTCNGQVEVGIASHCLVVDWGCIF